MRSEWEKMLSGELYDAGDPEITRRRQWARQLCLRMNAADEEGLRRIARVLFGNGGDTVTLTPPFHCDYGSQIHLGEKVYFNVNCVLLDVCEIRIGDFTLFGPAVQLYTATHPLDARQRRREESGRPIEIGSDVWLGGGSIVLPGVKIGSRSVIGAGSVVTRDIPEGVLAVGNPCRVLREIH